MNPKVSIIVPVYNVELYLHDCINSILEQSLPEFELILIDDGSSDTSGEICDYYAQQDKRIKVIHKKNEGPSPTRNIGINVSKGEYIGFVDSDDIIENSMYEKMYKNAVERNADIVACGYLEINDSKKITNKYTTPLKGKEFIEGPEVKKSLEELLSNNKLLGYASLCNKLYKKEFIIKNNLLNNEKIKIAEDLCMNIAALSKSNRISAVNEALYKYRRINNESLMNKKEGSFYLHLDARKEILNTLKLNNISSDVYTKVLKYENFKTVAEYLREIQRSFNSKEKGLREKYQEVHKLIHEQYFLNSIYNYDKSHFVYKAKAVILLLKGILYIEKLLVFRKSVSKFL